MFPSVTLLGNVASSFVNLLMRSNYDCLVYLNVSICFTLGSPQPSVVDMGCHQMNEEQIGGNTYCKWWQTKGFHWFLLHYNLLMD